MALLLLAFSSCSQAQNQLKDYEDGMYAKITTTKGEILLKLYHEQAPMTVANFVALAEGNMKNKVTDPGVPYYDGLKFHRVIDNFMIQGGDPLGTGAGDPGYKFPDEIDPELKHEGPGVLSMANAGPGTNGSQFFITHVATPWLDGKHTIFGKVMEGQEVVDTIQQGDVMEKVEIIRNGKEAKNFKAVEVFQSMQEELMAAEKEKIASLTKSFKEMVENKHDDVETLESGLMIVRTKTTDGAQPKAGQTVTVHYTGTFEDGKKFDSSVDRGQPFSFPIGNGRVIPGWDQGLMELKVGEKALLYIPYDLAYGAQGYPGAIPPYSNLVFEVELIDLK